MKNIHVVVIDDEPLAREGIAGYVKEFDFLTLVGSCENPLQLMQILNEQAVDLIFLDIQMPKMHGIDFLRTTTHRPMVVLITAFPEYAIESFQLDVIDYLLKPVTFDRFFKSVNKAREYFQLLAKSTHQLTQKTAKDADYFFIKCGSTYEKIKFAEVLFVEGMENYVTIYTEKDKYITLLNLKTMEKNLEGHHFIRVHKSYVVAVAKIERVEGNEIFIHSHRIPISRTYKEKVLSQVLANKLWSKGM